ncbi:hypothetical protein DXA46_01950 [Bacteroides sp. OF02-3LB]|jgi:uncharacterized membrane protein YphA (DoxX/SURF4 family)|nr:MULTISPECIES: BT_3928 family protein [Bacteroides]QNL40523.1 hypothetical protein H8796_08050 [Bacteroides sp. M10]RGY36812.1 hypothetical protein DXA46_01950 [Bacteroides sp. OF02-3LB]
MKKISFFLILSKIVLGLTFLFSGFVKSVDVYGTTFKIVDYFHAFHLDIFQPLSKLLAFGIVGFEFLLGILIIIGIYAKVVSKLVISIVFFMMLLTLYIALFNNVEDCGCFGDVLILSNWATFFKNIVLLIFAFIFVIYHRLVIPLFSIKIRKYVLRYSFIYISGILLYSYIYEPLFDFRPYHVGAKLMPFDSINKKNKDQVSLIYRKDGEEKVFTPETAPWQNGEWTYVETRINSLNIENTKSIADFSIQNIKFDKENKPTIIDITDKVLLDSEYSFFLLIPDLSILSDIQYDTINKIALYAGNNKCNVYCLTASTRNEVLQFKENLNPEIMICLADNRLINTIVRTSPGLMIMKKGLIVAKWSRWSFPFDLHLGCNMNELITSSPSSVRIGPIILAVLLLLLPMMVFKIKDKRINNRFMK